MLGGCRVDRKYSRHHAFISASQRAPKILIYRAGWCIGVAARGATKTRRLGVIHSRSPRMEAQPDGARLTLPSDRCICRQAKRRRTHHHRSEEFWKNGGLAATRHVAHRSLMK
jgi:hypothetical protein